MNAVLQRPDGMELATPDVDVITDAVSRVFGHHVILRCGPPSGHRRLSAWRMSEVVVGSLLYESEMSCVVDQPRRCLTFTVPNGCAGQMGRHAYLPGDVLAFEPDWVGRLELRAPGHFLNACFQPEQAWVTLRALLGAEPDGLPSFDTRLAADHPVTRHILQVLRVLHDAPPSGAVLQRARESWALLEILGAWPHSLARHLTSGFAGSRALRRALDFIDAHLDQPITLQDLALASHVGVRALADSFVRQMHETPARYIRGRRLEAARLALQRGDAPSVAEVASRWQFSNPGVFARYFRQRFGRLPGELRRSSQP